ncbi:COG4 transport protein-domain-containing protein [Collybia nuda]|uniref:Conserved oligomeric Golgi complex subunit 4 n=1 Tax=Collybia nuda TaxID=64659 RepID=A0A9P5XYU4_9AGAR|nr:COG4 transport protein-domain-containing protein [Collybia nuda]
MVVGGPSFINFQLQQQTSAKRYNPRALTNLPDILSCLAELQSEEAELSNSLAELLNTREPIAEALNRLQSLLPKLDGLHLEALSLTEKVSNTAKTARRVGGRVRSLDEEMGRVREAGDHVGQVIELKSSLVALQSSIESQDWESATRHCARAMALPSQLISGAFAESAVPTSESHLPPAQTLQNAREKLLSIFRQNFNEASRSRDSTATSRFFKLFPTIGWEAEGLEVYAQFVVDLVRFRAPASAKTSSPLYYVTALTALFESIAMIVDQHQPVVEKYYGPGKMKSVIARLLQECDRVLKGLVDGWEEERAIRRKLLDITNHPPILMFSPSARRLPSTNPEEVVVDPRDIDRTLSELSGMIGRWSLFKKFLTEALKEDSGNTEPCSNDESSSQELKTNFSINSTHSHHLIETLIKSYYIPLEVWYIRTSIDKAHRLSITDSTQSPATTTTPDDVFYILKAVISRLISTGSLNSLERMLEHLHEIMEHDYIGIIKKRLDDVYRTSGPSGTSVRADKVERENRNAFLILLNDLDISSSHLERLVRDMGMNQAITQHYPEDTQLTVKNVLSNFANLTVKFRSALRVGVEQLFNQLMRPRLRTLISDVYKDVSYVLDDDSYSGAEYQDVVRKRFIKAWESLIDGYKGTFTDGNYRLFFGLTLDVVLRPWEKIVMGLRFTELGAVQFDRDLRSITAYLTTQTAFGDTREKFVRLQQMSTLLNLDNEEDVDEFYNSSGITWKLTATEARAIVGLKL